MRTPRQILRVALIASACHLAVACAINPFDGDPKGAPPAPRLWSGDYAGDNASGSPYEQKRPTRTASNDSQPYRPGDGGYDEPAGPRETAQSDYGTSSVASSELPPPGGGAVRDEAPTPRAPDPLPPPREAVDLPPPVDYQSEGDFADSSASAPVEPQPAATPRGGRTLSTKKGSGQSAPTPSAPAEVAEAPKAGKTKLHRVKSGEELADIADNYGVREVEIIALNGLKPPYTLKSGQELKIPSSAQASAAQPGEFVVAGTPADVPSPKAKPGAKEGKAPKAETVAAKSGGEQFDWPVSGKVIAGFGAGDDGLYNEGINIAVPTGTAVRASAGGTVRYAGNELRGYGNLVLIEHSNGYITAYAHNQSLTVARGDKVGRGDVIAKSGQTGNVKSPQLHFEIRKGKESVDPRKYLVAMN